PDPRISAHRRIRRQDAHVRRRRRGRVRDAAALRRELCVRLLQPRRPALRKPGVALVCERHGVPERPHLPRGHQGAVLVNVTPPGMRTTSLSGFTLELFTAELGHTLTRSRDDALWAGLEATPIAEADRAALAVHADRLKRFHLSRANEATLWSRAIYPVLILA